MFAAYPFAAAPFGSFTTGPIYVDGGGAADGVGSVDARIGYYAMGAGAPKGVASASGWGQRILESVSIAPGWSYTTMAANAWQMARAFALGYATASVRAQTLSHSTGAALGSAALDGSGTWMHWSRSAAAGAGSVFAGAISLIASQVTARGVAYVATPTVVTRTAAGRGDGLATASVKAGRIIWTVAAARGASALMAVGVIPGDDEGEAWIRGISSVIVSAYYTLDSRMHAAGFARISAVGQALFDGYADMRSLATAQAMAQAFAVTASRLQGAGALNAVAARSQVLYSAASFAGQGRVFVAAAAYAVTKANAQGRASFAGASQYVAAIMARAIAKGAGFVVAAGQSTKDGMATAAGRASARGAGIQVLSAAGHAKGVAAVNAVPGNQLYTWLPPAMFSVIRPYEDRASARGYEDRKAVR